MRMVFLLCCCACLYIPRFHDLRKQILVCFFFLFYGFSVNLHLRRGDDLGPYKAQLRRRPVGFDHGLCVAGAHGEHRKRLRGRQ